MSLIFHTGEMEVIPRDEKEYPLKNDGTIDWELTEQEKQAVLDEYNSRNAEGFKTKKPKKKYGTNYTPPKKRRK